MIKITVQEMVDGRKAEYTCSLPVGYHPVGAIQAEQNSTYTRFGGNKKTHNVLFYNIRISSGGMMLELYCDKAN